MRQHETLATVPCAFAGFCEQSQTKSIAGCLVMAAKKNKAGIRLPRVLLVGNQ